MQGRTESLTTTWPLSPRYDIAHPQYLSLLALISSVFVLESQDVLNDKGCLALSWITQLSLGLCTTVVSACLAW